MAWTDNIWKEIQRMKKQMDNLTDRLGFGSDFDEDLEMTDELSKDYRKAFSNFKETDNEYFIEVEIPGVNKEDIKLNTTERGIEIKAEKKKEKEKGGEEDEEYSYTKSYAGFYQNFDVPEDADLDNLEASYEKGVLTIKLPKKQKDKDKKYIKIK